LPLANALHQHALEFPGGAFKIIISSDKLFGTFAYAIAQRSVAEQKNSVSGKFFSRAADEKMNTVPPRYAFGSNRCRDHRQSRGHTFQHFSFDSRSQAQGKQGDLHAQKEGPQVGHKPRNSNGGVSPHLPGQRFTRGAR